MLLALHFFSINDLVLAPICFFLLWMIVRNRANNCADPFLKKLYYRGFYFKIFCVLAYTFVTEFVFHGGDTALYYQGVKDLRNALNDDFNFAGNIIKTLKLDIDNPLTPYFYYDNYEHDFTYNYMLSPSNFFVPRLGLIPGYLFFDNYLCINMVFGFFAFGGAIRLFKSFYHFFPKYGKELAVAVIFLPSVGFWSAGLLKDPICFGSIGYILYALINIFIKKTNYKSSITWIIICGFMIYHIKVYILLVLILAVFIWLFAETNKLIADRTLRGVFSFFTLSISMLVGVLMLNYFTSQEAAQQYKLDTLMDKTEYQRKVVEDLAANGVALGSNFSINTSNPVALVVNGLVATLFRPFPWEVSSPAMIFSAIEAALFLFLILNFFFRRGFKKFFSTIFNDPRLLMCFVFTVVFGLAVGASTANFGALSRYKIPCMPFFAITVLLSYKAVNLPYPKFLTNIINRVTR